MVKGFNFDEFDFEIAKALGEVPLNTPIETFTPLRIVPESTTPTTAEIEKCNALRGIRSLGATVLPHGLKPAS